MAHTTHRADATALLDNRGYSGALIRGQNPALLFEKAVRDRITTSMYWQEQCYGLNGATLVDRAVELSCVGGTYGAMGKPTPFLCLAFKLCQLVPEKEVVLALLNWHDEEDEDAEAVEAVEAVRKTGEFKYLRALAAFYVRLVWEPVEIYQTLEPLLADFRKIKRRTRDGYALTYMDQFIDDLLTKDRICATSLWKLPGRTTLEDLDMLEPRESPLGEELDELDNDDEVKEENGSYSSPESDRRSHTPSSRSERSQYSDDEKD